MIFVLNPSDSLTAVLASTATTTNPTYAVLWSDPGGVNDPTGSLNGATAVTLVSAPSGGQRTVKELIVYNGDTVAATLTIAKVVSGTSYTLLKVAMGVGDTLRWTASGLALTDSSGQLKAVETTPATYVAMAASGAIVVKEGTVYVTKAGVAALTLADPTATTDDGKVLRIVSATANAHTIDNSAGSGFNAAGSGGDIGTLGGAKGDNLVVTAYQGKWYVISSVNCTMA